MRDRYAKLPLRDKSLVPVPLTVRCWLCQGTISCYNRVSVEEISADVPSRAYSITQMDSSGRARGLGTPPTISHGR